MRERTTSCPHCTSRLRAALRGPFGSGADLEHRHGHGPIRTATLPPANRRARALVALAAVGFCLGTTIGGVNAAPAGVVGKTERVDSKPASTVPMTLPDTATAQDARLRR